MTEETNQAGLNLKQRRFLDAYLGEANGNGTRAAKIAGYSPKGARQQSQWLLQHPRVLAELQRRYAEEAMAASEVLRRLADQARNRLSEFLKIDSRGKVRFDLKAAKADGLAHLVKAIKYDAKGNQVIETYDAQAALVHIGKHLRIFDEHVDVTSAGLPLNVVAIDVVRPAGGE